MSATLIPNAAPGEELIGIEPELLEQVDAGWRQRLALFTGRTLTAAALQSEQAYRAGRLAILGQCVTQGTVKGLELSADFTQTDPVLQVAPGYGISATGEDVTLLRTLRTTLGSLQVIDPQTGSVIDTFPNYSKNTSNTTYAGVLILQPIVGQVSGSAVDTGALPVIVSGNLDASCDQDPDEYAFEDWQIVDGVQLVMVAWPSSPASLALPAAGPAATWRNRLVNTIFNAEMALTADDRLPWDVLGVPVALIGFNNTWEPQFVDRSAVVRSGGLPRSRYVLPAQTGNPNTLLLVQPALAQARISQLAEQLGESPSLTNLVQSFAFLPPCGVLPASAMDFNNQVGLWFPPNWAITVGPVYQEEIETALLTGMTAQPLDVTQNEAVEVLVPLPDSLYDPHIFTKETVDPAFQAAVNSATQELEAVLQHRDAIEQEANVLSQAVTGTSQAPPYDVDAGLTTVEIALRGPQVFTLTVDPHSITAVYSGDAKNATSTSAPLVQTVAQAIGSVALGSSVNPSAPGQAVTLTATVSSASSSPATGSVQFMDGKTALGSPVPLSNGVAVLPVSSFTTAASHSITASYGGDKNNPASVSAILVQTVAATLPVTLSSSMNPSALGQAVTITATVAPNSATGSVQFMDGATALGAPVLLSAGVATLQVYVPASSETFGTEALNGAYVSVDYQKLVTDAGKSPYTLTQDGNGNPLSSPLPLFSADDMQDMAQNGIQHFIDRINAKLASANDLLDLAFLTTQSDIYRLRNNVLVASDATALAVSPIVAQIATGESAAVTSSNLQSYLSSILPTNSPPDPPTTTTPPPTTTASRAGITLSSEPRLALTPFRPTAFIATAAPPATIVSAPVRTTLPASTLKLSTAATSSLIEAPASRTFVQASPGTAAQPASTIDVTGASPLVGAQLNLRTLTIAQRMSNPPSQDALFYATGNRVALLQLLADLEITIADIPILVDSTPPPATGGTTPLAFTMADMIAGADATRKSALTTAVLTPTVNTAPSSEPDEAALFSTSIHVLEQHSSLLRAIEGRVQQYKDFLTECAAALANIQSDLPSAETLVTQLQNDLAQARQDVAFTTSLLNDEIARVADVNAQRTYTLQNYVQAVVYTRPRTLQPNADVPSRQLVPGNIASPVPSCLQQSVAIPPELREIVALLREAPVTWMPSIEALLNRLERPSVLQNLAVDAQARATMQLTLPLRTSSAASESGVYAPVVASIYSANQQAFRTVQAQRAAAQPAQLLNLSWMSQIQTLQNFTAAGDLLSSDAVHAEVVNATSRLMQQISSVATCLYARACQALPIDRLAWAEFLSGTGLSIQMQSLAVLPNWNTQDYVTRQQTQMLVDWLFQQIDTTNGNAVAFMSDVVRTSILLASDAPVSQVIGGAVTLATTPAVGGVVSLTLPSDRVAHGMYVQLYSSGVLTAQAVVSDLDNASVRATVTKVYQSNVALQVNDVAHFTAQAPQTPALRAFDM